MSNLPPPPPPPPPGRGRGPLRPSGDQRPTQQGGGEGGDGGMRRPGNWPRWTMWVLLGVVALALVLPSFWPSDSGTDLTYTEFIAQVQEGNVRSVVISNNSNSITGELANGDKFTTTGGGNRGVSEADEALLNENEVDYTFRTEGNNWFLSIAGLLLPVLLIIGFFVWMQRRAAGQMGNVMSIGRSRAKAYTTDKPSTTFADIAGYEGVKQEITEVVDFLRMPDRFREIGARVPKGMLLVGPPGTGKTLFA
ncbi:MAG: ATP-dependent metallopeptidase FtsH/Yme1/Tma family protein, partial [Ilumatobacteraceae bacterium]